MSDFNPTRLDLARRRRGMTKRELAEKAGISTRVLTAYENDEKSPSELTLMKLANALEFPRDFLCGPDLDEPPPGASSFRALSNLTARQVGQAYGSGALALALDRWIHGRFQLPPVDVPKLSGLDPETCAEIVRKEWGLGEKPIGNLTHLLEAHGIRVFSLVEECAEVDAYSFWLEGTPYVFLNTMKSAEHGRMDAAHELGHLVMHWRHETPRGREIEHEAKNFASAFLMPRADVLAKSPARPTLGQMIRTKKRWKVSVAALVYRLHKLNLLSEWQYRTLFLELSQKGYRKKEPDECERETSQVLPKVFAALRQDGVTKNAVARELTIPLAELNKLIFGLVLTPVDGENVEIGQEGPTRRDLRLV